MGVYLFLGIDPDSYDRLFKVRQLYDHVKKNCLELPPEELNSIDEQMIPYKGKKSAMRQYNKAKPVKWGFKVFSRCGAKTGIIYDFNLYTGNLKFLHLFSNFQI